MKKRITIFILISMLGIIGLHFIYGWLIRKNDFNKVWWLNHKHNEKYDFVFLGNSRVYTMLQTDQLEKEWHQTGLNISLDGADLSQQYLMLYLFLKNGNKTHNLYMNIDFTELALPMNNELRVWCFLPVMDDQVYNVLRQNYGRRAILWKYVPFYKYAEYNSRIGLLTVANSILQIEKRPFNVYGDFSGLPNRRFNILDTFNAKYITPAKADLYYFEKILTVCTQNHINIHLYTAPAYKTVSAKWLNRKEIIDRYILPLASKYKAGYSDYTDIPLSGNAAYFIDVTHLNLEGRKKWMEYVLAMKYN